MDRPEDGTHLEASLLQFILQGDPPAPMSDDLRSERLRILREAYSVLRAPASELGPLRLDFVESASACAPGLDWEAIADRIEVDWLRPLEICWKGDPWKPIPMQLPSGAARELRAAAEALRTAREHIDSLQFARWLLTTPPMGSPALLAGSEDDRKLSDSLAANAELLDRAAAMKERQKGPGNRARSTISAQCAAGLLHHLTRNGLAHSEKTQPAYNAAARWAWRYLNLPGDPLECVRTALRSEQPPQAGPAPKSSAGPWDQLIDGR